MARKKRARRVRRSSRRAARSSRSDIKKSISVVLNQLLLFVALSLVSFVLYRFLQNAFLVSLFEVMAMIFGFVAVGFLVTLLVLLIIKIVRKR